MSAQCTSEPNLIEIRDSVQLAPEMCVSENIRVAFNLVSTHRKTDRGRERERESTFIEKIKGIDTDSLYRSFENAFNNFRSHTACQKLIKLFQFKFHRQAFNWLNKLQNHSFEMDGVSFRYILSTTLINK